jgi:frataxin-like iron-binding protein CyaY
MHVHPTAVLTMAARAACGCITPSSSSRSFASAAPVDAETETHGRILTTATTDEQFARVSAAALETIADTGDGMEMDGRVEETNAVDGVVSIRTPNGTFVINAHSVTRQLWLSSPISGPSKYNYHGDGDGDDGSDGLGHVRWRNERDAAISLHERLETELQTASSGDADVQFDDAF